MFLFSITAHERLDILAEQIGMIERLNPGSQYIVHLSARLAGEEFNFPGVVVNPQRLRTYHCHIFHAILSNARLALSMPDWDQLVLLSSGDVPIRPMTVVGPATSPHSPYDPTWHFNRSMEKNCPPGPLRFSFHEATAYSREIIETLVEMPPPPLLPIYPREEIILPTLLGSLGIAPQAPRTHLLGFGGPDAAIIAAVIRSLPVVDPEVLRWASKYPGELPDDLAFISRVPRRKHALRQMLHGQRNVDLRDLRKFG
jgi:hypothetical protein